MIARCKDGGLKQPQLWQDGSQFGQTLWQWLLQMEIMTPEVAPEVTLEVAKLLPLCVRPVNSPGVAASTIASGR